MEYRLVFDIAEAGFKNWKFSVFGLLFVAVGILLVAFRGEIGKGRHWIFRCIFPFCFLGFSVLWTLVVFLSTYGNYRRHSLLMREGRASLVEGRVENFVPMAYHGHGLESFEVNGVRFEYSDYVVSPGFNNSKSHGGPIDEGRLVRIHHRDGIILRLEIKDERRNAIEGGGR